MTEETFVCSICGKSYPLYQRREFEGEELCEHCLDTETCLCEDCGERIWLDDNAGSDSLPLCQLCYERHYVNCSRCGALLHDDDAYYSRYDPDNEEPLCYSCYEHRSQGAIHAYSYKPDPIFYGAGKRYFGVELEIDCGGESDESAHALLEITNASNERAYCKHDGSLNEGFEIVTHPMTLSYHQDFMPWREMLHSAVQMGYQSHRTGTCGLHIHVNRDSFGETEIEQDACIVRVLFLVEKYWDELLKFSRRTQSQLDHWAARYGYKDRPMEILDHAKKGYGNGRYSCVNLQNRDTIEFRIFRGTLKHNTLIATLQLVNKLCDVAISMPDSLLQPLAWSSFVLGIKEPELVQYLKERRLYVNEPLEGEEDD